MYNFSCDYLEGAHEEILQRMMETNREQTPGYSLDKYSENAKQLIKKACGNEQLYVHLVVGGTQANTIVISSLLKPYQGVISADEGHVSVHETGAIEAKGHKVIALSTEDGKLNANQVDAYISWHENSEISEHIVEPGMVYISYPTEGGLLYSKKELQDLYAVCKKKQVPLYIDGARLGYALCSPYCDLTLKDIPNLCDVFYIGGTKVGALFGEAIVTTNETLKRALRPMIKQQGALFAKGRLLGIQFETLFTNNLYFKGARHGIKMAEDLSNVFKKHGIPFVFQPQTNQIFVKLTSGQLKILSNEFEFDVWETVDDTSTVRFATSWATEQRAIDELDRMLS